MTLTEHVPSAAVVHDGAPVNVVSADANWTVAPESGASPSVTVAVSVTDEPAATAPADDLTEMLGDGTGVADGVGVVLGLGDADGDGVGDELPDGAGVGVGDDVSDGAAVGVGVGDEVSDGAGVGVGDEVSDGAGVGVGDEVSDGAGVGAGLSVGDGVGSVPAAYASGGSTIARTFAPPSLRDAGDADGDGAALGEGATLGDGAGDGLTGTQNVPSLVQ